MEDLASRPAELDERARAMRWWYDGTMARVAANVEATLQAVAANTPRVPSYTLLLSHFARDPRGPISTARYAEIEGAIRSNLLGRDLAEVWVLYEQRPGDGCAQFRGRIEANAPWRQRLQELATLGGMPKLSCIDREFTQLRYIDLFTYASQQPDGNFAGA